jgi:hypothetical protein
VRIFQSCGDDILNDGWLYVLARKRYWPFVALSDEFISESHLTPQFLAYLKTVAEEENEVVFETPPDADSETFECDECHKTSKIRYE